MDAIKCGTLLAIYISLLMTSCVQSSENTEVIINLKNIQYELKSIKEELRDEQPTTPE